MRDRILRNLLPGALMLALVACAYGAWTLFFDTILKIPFEYATNLGESPMAQAIRIFHEGRWPYHDLKNPPYSLVPYGPVYLWLGSVSLSFFQGPFAGPRFVGFVSTSVLAYMIFLILREKQVRPVVAFLGSFLFLAHPYVQRWNAQVNVDMTAVCLEAAAFLCFMKASRTQIGIRYLEGAGVGLAILAFFTKSSMMAAPAAYFFYLLCTRRPKRAFLILAAIAVPVLICYGWLNLSTDGQYYFHTTYEIGKRLYFWQFIYRFWIDAAIVCTLPVLVTLFFLVRGLMRRRADLLHLYLILVVLMTVSVGKQGSDTNYLLEWCVATCLVLGTLIEEAIGSEGIRARGLRPFAGPLLIVVAAAQVLWWHRDSDPMLIQKGYRVAKGYYDELSDLIRRTPGDILTEDMGLLIANDLEIFYEPLPMGQMSYSGAWDEKIALDLLERRHFSLAILQFYAPMLKANRTFTTEFMRVFNARYHFVARAAYPDGSRALFFYAPNE